MPFTDKERAARRRARLKASPEAYAEHLQRDKLRKAKQRKTSKRKMNKQEWALHRAQENIRIQNYRQKKKGQDDGADSAKEQPYTSRQAMGKAVSRVRSSLPRSPRKRKAIAAAIANELGFEIKSTSRSSQSGRPSIDSDVIQKVLSFYEKDDISWQAPGRKDRVIIRSKDEQGEKVKTYKQAKYMLMSLAEAHSLFCNEEGVNISRGKFCELRPKHIKLFNDIPHNVCVCTYHENVRLLLVPLSKCTPLTDNISAFTDSMVCDAGSKQCMSQECSTCKEKIEEFRPSEGDMPIMYSQWQTTDGAHKVDIHTSANEAFDELKRQLKAFLIHVYIKRQQSAYIEELRSKVDGEEVLLQVDFSENATLTEQDEVQTGHWSHGQATLFTAHAWITEDINESIVIVSDELQHNKFSVKIFMEHIFSMLKKKYPSITTFNVVSDGASSQFKQRFLFSNLAKWESELNINLKWHFFATSHGKGVVDGLGGAVKGSVWRWVKSNRGRASTPYAFYQAAVKRNPSITMKFISKDEVMKGREETEAYWQATIPVPNTHRIHCVVPISKHHLLVREVSASEEYRHVRIREDDLDDTLHSMDESSGDEEADDDLDINIGDWVLVDYQGESFPGEVVEFGESNIDLKVNVMHPAGAFWRWPQPSDQIFYLKKDVTQKIAPPTVAGNRGQFSFIF